MKKFKKLLAGIMTLAMLVTMLPTTVLADDTVTEPIVEGSVVDPVEGETAVEDDTPAASVNGTDYSTLQEAIWKAEDGAEVLVKSDLQGEGIVIQKNITINMDEHTYTLLDKPVGSSGTETLGFQILAQNDATPYNVTIKNGTINVDDSNLETQYFKMLVQNYCNLKLVDMVLDGTNLVGNCPYTLSNNNGNTVITGESYIIEADGGVAFDLYDYKPHYKGVKVTFDEKFTGGVWGGYEVGGIVENEEDKPDATLTVAGGHFRVEVDVKYLATGKCLAESNKDGYHWMVVDKTVDNDKVTTKDPVINTPEASITGVGVAGGAVTEAKNAIDEEALKNAGIAEATSASTKDAAVKALIKAGANPETEEVQIIVKPKLEMNVEEAESNNLKLDIKAVCDIKATAGSETVTVAEGQELDMAGKEIEVTVPLPTGFTAGFDSKIKVYHFKGGKLIDTHEATVNNNGTATFKNDKGFSTFILTTTDVDAAANGNVYSTLKDAVAAANEVDGGATITLTDNVTLSEKLTIKKNITISGKHTITRGIAGTIFAVDKNATLTLDGGVIIDGGNNWAFDSENYYADMATGKLLSTGAKDSYSTSAEGGIEATAAMISISGTKGQLVMNNATIQNNWGSPLFVVPAGATLTMNEGTLVKHIRGQFVNPLKGTWVINGGKITDVHAHNTNGGLVDMRESGKFTIKDGEICNVTILGLDKNGNGILAQVYGESTKLTINGGNIHDNASFSPGGGWGSVVYLNRGGDFEMNGGTITTTKSDHCTAFVSNTSTSIVLNKGTINVEESKAARFDSLIYGDITIGKDMVINGDGANDELIVILGDAGNTFNNNGKINGNIQLATAEVTGDGEFNGDVTIKPDDYFEFDGVVKFSGGTWSGTITVTKRASLEVTDEATITGEIIFEGGSTMVDTSENQTVVEIPEDVTSIKIPGDKLDEVTTDENGNIILPEGSEVKDKDGNIVTMPAGGKVNVDGTVTQNPVPVPSTPSKKSTKKYAVSIDADEIENGTIKLSPSKAKKGATVTLTVTPDAGYELDKLVVLDKDGNEVELKDKGDGKFTFKMPRGGVEVDASFAEADAVVAKDTAKIVLTIDSIVALVNGEPVVNDVAPIIKGERTFLPIRLIAEELGATVTWNETEQSVTIVKDDMTIVIYIGQAFALVNGEPVQLDEAAFIVNGRTYLPLRFVAENLGAVVTWDGLARTVTIVAE